MREQFFRSEMLWGQDGQQRLAAAHVIVFGLGGVGSYAAECLARAGIGELTLVDSDTVSVTNLNRQLEALWSTVGQPKPEAMAARIRDIHPEAVLHPIHGFYDAAVQGRRCRLAAGRRSEPPAISAACRQWSRLKPPGRL